MGSWCRFYGVKPAGIWAWANGSSLKRSYTITSKTNWFDGVHRCKDPAVSPQPLRYATNQAPPISGAEIGRISAEIVKDGKQLAIEWPTGSRSRFHSVWLRFNCHCPVCRQPLTGQKSYDIPSVPKVITLKEAVIKDNIIELFWHEQPDHRSPIPLDFLRRNCYMQETLELRESANTPVTYGESKLPEVEFSDILKEEGSRSLLKDVMEHGLCIVKNVPTEKDTVTKVAETFAPVQPTIYGRTYDVVSEPVPINIAYTPVELDLHMDFAYHESPAGIQLFHCLRFDACVEGGESRYLDVFHVAEKIRKDHPREFDILTRIPATFEKIHHQREIPVHITYQRPHIMLNHRKQIVGVFWAPVSDGPLAVNEDDVEPYYEAYRLLADCIRQSDMIKQIRLEPGDTVVFNNRRILHGRNAFSLNGGVRHFQGCFVNVDEFKSKFQFLSNSTGDGSGSKRVGNQCWF